MIYNIYNNYIINDPEQLLIVGGLIMTLPATAEQAAPLISAANLEASAASKYHRRKPLQ